MAWGSYLLKKLFDALISAGLKAGLPFFGQLSRKAHAYWNGKKIAIIGATASGKDSLFNRLEGKKFRRLTIKQEHLKLEKNLLLLMLCQMAPYLN